MPDEAAKRILDDREHVRTRPGMYVGGLNLRGLHHLVWELVDNSIREASNGFGRMIRVTIHADGSCTVADHGRGIPVGSHPAEGVPTAEVVFSKLCRAANVHGDPESAYGPGAGLCGVGAAVTNFLSERLDVQISRDGHVHQMRFERGLLTQPLSAAGPTGRTGTRITFRPDRLLFKGLAFDRQVMSDRLRGLAALHGGVEIAFEDDRVGHRAVFRFDAGASDYVHDLAGDAPPLTGVVAFRRTDPAQRIAVDGALQYVDRPGRSVLTFVNDRATVSGTHLDGFHAGLGMAFDRWASASGVTLGRDVRRVGGLWCGLVGVVSVRMAEPRYRGCTRAELESPEVKAIVAAAVVDRLADHLRARPEQARSVVAIAGRPRPAPTPRTAR